MSVRVGSELPKYLKFTLWLNACLFVLVMAGYASFNRIAADDFPLAVRLKLLGFFHAQLAYYLTWSGRWVANFWQNLFALFRGPESGSLFLFTMATTTVWMLGVQILFDSLVRRAFKNASSLWPFGVLFSQLLLVITPNLRESLFWPSGSTCYLWGVAAFFGALGLALRKEKSTSANILLFLFAVCAGGSNETLSAFALGTAIASAPFWMRSSDGELRKSCWIGVAGMCASYLAMIVAPGNRVRLHELHHEIRLLPAILGSFEAAFSNPFNLVRSNFKQLLIGAVAAYYFASLMADQFFSPLAKERRFSIILKSAAFAAFLVFATNFALMLPAMILGGGLPPDRSWIMNSAFTGLILFMFAGLLGALYPAQSALYRRILSGLIVVGVLVHASYRISLFTRQFAQISTYAREFDERGKLLKKYRSEGRKEPLRLEVLPYNDIYNIDYDAPEVMNLFELPFTLSENRKPVSR